MQKVELLKSVSPSAEQEEQFASGLFDFMGEPSKTNAAKADSQSASHELERYLDDQRQSQSPLLFWKDCKKVFPRLFVIAQQILCAPASTAGVERIFSIAGHILSLRRLTSSDAFFENQLFTNVNFGVLDVPVCKKLKLV